MMELSTIIELSGLAIILLTHLVLIVAKFQKHESQLKSIEHRLGELHENHEKLSENSKTLHNIEGKIEILINLYSKTQK